MCVCMFIYICVCFDLSTCCVVIMLRLCACCHSVCGLG